MDFEDAFDDNQEGGEEGENVGGQDMFMFGMDEKEAQELKQNKDSVVFLIDCHRSMHEKNPHNGDGNPSNINQILKACQSFMKSKIITSDNDKIGIVLYGCKQSNNSLNFNNIYVLQKLDTPDANSIKKIEELIPTFTKEHGFAPKEGQTPLFEALWICHQEFKSVEKQSYNKRIFLFTNEDNPGNENDKNMAQQRANDLTSLNVEIELFPMPKPQAQRPSFDVKKFYANIITFDEEEQFSELIGIQGTQSRINELMKRIRQKEFRKRTQGKCMFSLTPKTQIALSFYTTIMPTKKPGAAKVNSINNKQLKSTQRFICTETASVLYKNQIGTFYEVGGEKVKITPEDVKQIKFFDNVGMKLMGFKPKQCLKPFHNIKHSYFIYPDEKRITGSSQVMDALIKEMISEEKIAIVRFIPRDNSVVRFCALVPQDEKVDEEDGFQTPPGFQLIFLPYADDIRDLNQILEASGYDPEQLKEEESIIDTLTKDEKNAAKLLVKNMAIDFNSRNFENPSIQQFYAGLQALALNEEEPEPIDDLLEPDYEGMKRFDPILDRFKDIFFDGNEEDAACGGAGRGRGRGGARGGRGGATGGTRGGKASTQNSQATSTAGAGRGRGRGAKQTQMDDDDDERELPSQQVDNSKKRKENPVKANQKGAKKRKVDMDSEEDSLDGFIDDDSIDGKKKGKRGASKAAAKSGSQSAKKEKEEEKKSKGSAAKGSAKKGKKGKHADSDEEDNGDAKMDDLDKKFMGHIKEGTLTKINNNELKQFLAAKNLPAKGNKNFMIELIEEYFASNFNIS